MSTSQFNLLCVLSLGVTGSTGDASSLSFRGSGLGEGAAWGELTATPMLLEGLDRWLCSSSVGLRTVWRAAPALCWSVLRVHEKVFARRAHG